MANQTSKNNKQRSYPETAGGVESRESGQPGIERRGLVFALGLLSFPGWLDPRVDTLPANSWLLRSASHLLGRPFSLGPVDPLFLPLSGRLGPGVLITSFLLS